MVRPEELKISPWPWTHEYNTEILDSGGENIATTMDFGSDCGEIVYGELRKFDKPNAILMKSSPKLYESLYEAVIEMCHNCPSYQDSTSGRGKCNAKSGDCFVQKWRNNLDEAAGVEKESNEEKQ